MYCKYFFEHFFHIFTIVLIVAKCIVNVCPCIHIYLSSVVLIVAKCIVNIFTNKMLAGDVVGINSSKVYCKYSLL